MYTTRCTIGTRWPSKSLAEKLAKNELPEHPIDTNACVHDNDAKARLKVSTMAILDGGVTVTYRYTTDASMRLRRVYDYPID